MQPLVGPPPSDGVSMSGEVDRIWLLARSQASIIPIVEGMKRIHWPSCEADGPKKGQVIADGVQRRNYRFSETSFHARIHV